MEGKKKWKRFLSKWLNQKLKRKKGLRLNGCGPFRHKPLSALLFISWVSFLLYCCPLFFFFSVSPFSSIAHSKCKSTTKVRFSRWVQWAIHPWSIYSETFSALRGLKFGTFILYLQDISVNKKRMSFSPTNHCNHTQWKEWQWPPWPKSTHFLFEV